ncbi:MAG: cytochrome c [Actinobacteria bacterium]|nr:cytochrome c [Actinomycetota bacterium]
MDKSKLIPKTLLVVGGLAAAVGSAGCGNDSKADLTNGKQLFADKCGACHKLADANAQGVVGPDLDNAFRQSRADGMNSATIQGVVLGQIKDPSKTFDKSLRMPADIVSGSDARDVAAYVGSVAGKTAGDQGAKAGADASK